MDGWQLELNQMSPGKIDYCLSIQKIGGLQFFRERTNRVLMKRGACWPGSVIFSFVIHAHGAAWLGGHRLDDCRMTFLADGQQMPETLTPEGLDVLYIALDKRQLAEKLAACGQHAIAQRLLSHQAIALQYKDDLLQTSPMSQVVGQSDALHGAGAASGQLPFSEEQLLNYLLTVIGSAQSIHPVTDTHNKQVIDRARSLLLSDDGQSPSVTDVAAELGISRRYLQTCFNKAVGIPATAFVRAEKLNRVRRDLLKARQSLNTSMIGDVATEAGFSHLSRFAAEYRQLFGELPSETVRLK